MVAIFGLKEDVIFAEEKAHFIVEKDLHGVICEKKHRGILATAVLRDSDKSFLLGSTSLASLESFLESL
jgi:hypothetical protein